MTAEGPAIDPPTVDPGVHLRAALDALPAYVAGKPAAAAPAGVTAYKVSSNENPYPPLPSVADKVRDAVHEINRYPDMGVTALTQQLAERLEVDPAAIIFGTGSVDVLAKIMVVTCEPGDEVIFAWRSFEAYPIVATLAGATPVMVPLDADQRHDLGAMADAITERTRVVLICTPNNPTGPAVTQAEVDAFLARCPRDVLVVLDEAYLEFVVAEDAPDSLATWRAHPNVAVLRTFSKAYGLAGLRVGYAVAHPDVAAALRKAATPFGVSSLAQVAASASLDAFDELQVRVKSLVAERDRVTVALERQGWRLPDTQANFVYFPLGERSADFARVCGEAGLTVRPYGNDGVRVTIGETEANTRFIEVAGEYVKVHPPV